MSIIVLNYNGKAFLHNCLSSIYRISYPTSCYELIFVDNASTDGSVEYVANNFPKTKILALNKNFGFTEGNNRGAELANGELIAFLNNDTIVDKDWLSELVQTIRVNPRIGICGSKIMSMQNPSSTDYSGRCLHILGGEIASPPVINENMDKTFFANVGCIQGSSFIVWKNVFKNLMGFDKIYFMYSDEIDICNRAWVSGYYVTYASKSIVYHYGGGGSIIKGTKTASGLVSERLKSPFRIYYGNRNSLINIGKNLEFKNMLLGYLASILYFDVQLLGLLKLKNFSGIKLLFQAYLWPLKNLKVVWEKRIIIQSTRKITDQELIQRKMLLSLTGLIIRLKTEFFT